MKNSLLSKTTCFTNIFKICYDSVLYYVFSSRSTNPKERIFGTIRGSVKSGLGFKWVKLIIQIDLEKFLVFEKGKILTDRF